MQSFMAAAAILRRRSIRCSQIFSNESRRSLIISSFPSDSAILDDPHNSEVLVEGKANSRIAILNRPSILNALNTSMVARLLKLYQSWENNPDIGFVALKGSGKAFCAGGDVVGLYHSIN